MTVILLALEHQCILEGLLANQEDRAWGRYGEIGHGNIYYYFRGAYKPYC